METHVNKEQQTETVTGSYQGATFKQTRRAEPKKPVNNISNILDRKHKAQGREMEEEE